MKKIKLNLDQIEADLELNTPEENLAIKGGYDWSWFWNNWSNMLSGETYVADGNGGFILCYGTLLNDVTVTAGYGTISGGYGGYYPTWEQLNDPNYVYNYMQQNQMSPYGYQGPVEWWNCPQCNPGCGTDVWDNTYGNVLSEGSTYDGRFGADMLKIIGHMFH